MRSLINSLGMGKVMTIIAVGIGLAKHVFAVHRVDAAGRAGLVLPSATRGKLVERIAAPARCPIGIEARARAHHRAQRFVLHVSQRPAVRPELRHCASTGRHARQDAPSTRRQGRGTPACVLCRCPVPWQCSQFCLAVGEALLGGESGRGKGPWSNCFNALRMRIVANLARRKH